MPPLEKEEQQWFLSELNPHEDQLRSWLLGRFPGLYDVDDLIQEAYLRTIKVQRRKNLASPKAFLFATARNLAIDLMRRNNIIHFDSLMENGSSNVIDHTGNIQEDIALQNEFEILTEAIQSLPDRCRQIITLRKVYGLPIAQIAEKLNISTKTVEVQIYLGMKKCKQYFSKYNGEADR